MGSTAKELGIDRPSVDERLALMEEIWDSLSGEADSLAIPPSHVEELERRLASREARPGGGSGWDEVNGSNACPKPNRSSTATSGGP